LSASEFKVVSPSSHGSSLIFNGRRLLVLFLFLVTMTFKNLIYVVCNSGTLPMQKWVIMIDCSIKKESLSCWLSVCFPFLSCGPDSLLGCTWLFRNSTIVSHSVANCNPSEKFGTRARHGQVWSEWIFRRFGGTTFCPCNAARPALMLWLITWSIAGLCVYVCVCLFWCVCVCARVRDPRWCYC